MPSPPEPLGVLLVCRAMVSAGTQQGDGGLQEVALGCLSKAEPTRW